MTSINAAYSTAIGSGVQDYSGIQFERTQDQDQDGQGNGGGTGKVHHHRGGHMHDAVRQTLSSLGLTPAKRSDDGGQSTSATNGDATASSSVRQDMHDFMHALFEAVKGQSGTDASTSDANGSSAKDPGGKFSAGLNALITQVSNGQASAGLQDAFNKLVADAKGSTGETSDASNSANGPSPATLQDFLTKLQSNLGYGSAANGSAGSLVSAMA